MATVTPAYHAAWASREYIGDKRPWQKVSVRRGHFVHEYDSWAGDPIGALVSADDHRDDPWQATWVADTSWVEIPGISQVEFQKRVGSENGIKSATITIENILKTEVNGTVDSVATLFHSIERGALSPFRGFAADGRPESVEENSWFKVLARKSQIRVEQGWGEGTAVKTFTGLIDKTDMTAAPDRLVVTVRDFGGPTLTEQRFFGNVKDPQIPQPVTFIDALGADDIHPRGHDALASSDTGSHTAGKVVDTDSSTYWQSGLRGSTAAIEWIEIKVPQGRYASFYLWPKWAGMDVKLSIYVMPRADGRACQWNGATIPSNAWLDLTGSGIGGTTEGIPYIAAYTGLPAEGHYHELGPPVVPPQPNEIKVGAESKFRLHFTNLHSLGGGDFSAGVTRYVAMERTRKPDALRRHWILVDDVSDVVRLVLRWAGFKEWEVENTGVRLKQKLTMGAGDFLIDAIAKVQESVGFVFFIKDPTSADLSIGVPVFRNPSVRTGVAAELTLSDASVVPFAVTDQDLLLSLQVAWDEEPLAYIIRVRGKEDKDDGAVLIGYGTGTRRIWYTYKPPWTFEGAGGRLAGIYKHVVHTDNNYRTTQDCQLGCLLIALAEALESCKGAIEIPGHAGADLDQMVDLIDVSTGMNTRMWISGMTTTMHSGRTSSWKMTLEGSMVDTPDVVAVKAALDALGLGFSGES